ncbi:MAG: hypothetical protein V2B19_28125 [Pseudomonadota bacterium]
MIESAAYELIKQEGFQQGIQQGQLTASKDALMDLLMERFDIVPSHIIQAVNAIDNLHLLKMLRKKALKVPSIESFKKDLDMMIQ